MRKIMYGLALMQWLMLCPDAGNAQSNKENLWDIDITVNYKETATCDTMFSGDLTGHNKHKSSATGILNASAVAEFEVGKDSSFSVMWIPGVSQVIRSSAGGSYTETNVNDMQINMYGQMSEGEMRTDTWRSKGQFKLNSLNIAIDGNSVIADANAVFAVDYTVTGKWWGSDQQTNHYGWNPYDGTPTTDTMNIGAGGSSEEKTAKLTKVKGGWIITCKYTEQIKEPGNNYRLGPTRGTRITEATFRIKKHQDAPDVVMYPPEGFEEFLPEPNKKVSVKVKLVNKDDPKKPVNEVAQFRFELKDVTKEKGICVNYPVENAKETKDIKIEAADNAELSPIDDWAGALSKKGLKESQITLLVDDWGAFARLRVTAILSDGTEKDAYVEDHKDMSELTVPWDENNNRIADAWEKDHNIYDLALRKEDDDKYPENQREKGDGFSVYEEYRGFHTLEDIAYNSLNQDRKGQHVRTDPNYKDLFICYETGMFKKYYAQPNPAHLNWHIVDAKQMKIISKSEDADNRWVNVNSSDDAKSTKQYGLHMIYTEPRDIETAGEAVPFNGHQPEESVKYCKYIWLHPEGVFSTAMHQRFPVQWKCPTCSRGNVGREPYCPFDNTKTIITPRYSGQQEAEVIKNQYEATVLHEIGHGIGIMHHCNGEKKWIDPKDSTEYRLTKADRLHSNPVHQALATLGPSTCAMTYTFNDWRDLASSRVFTRQLLYCTDKEMYTDSYMQQRQADNCYKQIKIRCD